MGYWASGVSVASALLLSAMSAFGYGGEIEDFAEKGVTLEDYSDDMENLANSDGRVHGSWESWNRTLRFAGNTKAFQRFLDAFAKIPEQGERDLVLMAGTGSIETFDDETLRFDWTLSITKPPAPKPNEVRVVGLNTSELSESGVPRTRIYLYVDGNVTFEDLKIPDGIRIDDRRQEPPPNPDDAVDDSSAVNALPIRTVNPSPGAED